jgi:hypothetical protein
MVGRRRASLVVDALRKEMGRKSGFAGLCSLNGNDATNVTPLVPRPTYTTFTSLLPAVPGTKQQKLAALREAIMAYVCTAHGTLRGASRPGGSRGGRDACAADSETDVQ